MNGSMMTGVTPHPLKTIDWRLLQAFLAAAEAG